MTDNEIIKALECCKERDINCVSSPQCDVCPQLSYFYTVADREDCRTLLFAKTLDLINHLKAEIERLKSMNQAKLDTIHDLMVEVERLQNESIGNCEMAIAMRSDHNLEDDCNYCIDKAKSEAYKEIVEKLKEHLCSYDLPNYFSFEAVDEDTIDEILKELMEENK